MSTTNTGSTNDSSNKASSSRRSARSPSAGPARSKRKYDLIVFGATSFVGELVCNYLLNECQSDARIKWAMAGRSEDKLKDLQISFGEAAQDIPLIVADAMDKNALVAMCKEARVIISTVGPYALYGEMLVQACVETGTDYCDLTGEVQWIRRMIQRYEAQAQGSGARIVHCCGFDSIPSDMGVWFLQKEARARLGQPCERIRMRVRAARGGFSGGTVASLLNVAREAAGNADLRRELANPFSLCVNFPPNGTRQPSVKAPGKDPDFGVWVAPFVMAGINTRVVHRSNAVDGYPYGQDFRYDEAMMTGKGAKGWAAAQAITAGLGGFLVAAAIKPSRWLMEKYVLPAPGEGPSPREQKEGFYDLRFSGRTRDGGRLVAKVTGDRDPGYGSTCKMLAQAGLCLARDIKASQPGGFHTPSTLMGEPLLKRLTEHAGLGFAILPQAQNDESSAAESQA